MGSLIHYSGISTKIRAMERWRIKPEQFEQMAALESVLRQSVFFAPCRRMRRFFPVLRIKNSTGGGLNSF